MNKVLIGKKGEANIINYLESKGFNILERNYRYRQKEVDIIAKKDEIIAFVEVKLRTNSKFGEGVEAISNFKKRNIITVAKYYISSRNLYNYNIRFDVATITRNNLVYIENAFQI